jgi:hypothetical protein
MSTIICNVYIQLAYLHIFWQSFMQYMFLQFKETKCPPNIFLEIHLFVIIRPYFLYFSLIS